MKSLVSWVCRCLSGHFDAWHTKRLVQSGSPLQHLLIRAACSEVLIGGIKMIYQLMGSNQFNSYHLVHQFTYIQKKQNKYIYIYIKSYYHILSMWVSNPQGLMTSLRHWKLWAFPTGPIVDLSLAFGTGRNQLLDLGVGSQPNHLKQKHKTSTWDDNHPKLDGKKKTMINIKLQPTWLKRSVEFLGFSFEEPGCILCVQG